MNAAVALTLISIGGKMVDLREDRSAMVKVLPPWQGLDGNAEIALRYTLCRHFILRGGYHFSLLRLSAWDCLLLAIDTVYYGLGIRLWRPHVPHTFSWLAWPCFALRAQTCLARKKRRTETCRTLRLPGG
jgi:hypothetical protein